MLKPPEPHTGHASPQTVRLLMYFYLCARVAACVSSQFSVQFTDVCLLRYYDRERNDGKGYGPGE